jgi:hypothetical protein
MTRDEALMWLNDHTGMPAAVHVYVDIGGGHPGADVVSVEQGSLAHWSGDVVEKAYSRDDLAGHYHIGVVNIDVTDIAHFCEFASDSLAVPRVDTLTIELGGNVTMEILAWPHGVPEFGERNDVEDTP